MANDEQTDFDDIDDIFGDLDDLDPDSNSEPKELSTREAINAVATGAMDSIKDSSFLEENAKLITRNALPQGYSTALDEVDKTIAGSMDLYNSVSKPLKQPIKDLKKALHGKADSIPDIFGERFKNAVKSFTEVAEEEENPTASSLPASPDVLALDSAMQSVFSLQQGQMDLGRQSAALALSRDAKQDTVDEAGMMLEQGISHSLSNLVSYQNNINYKYQQKSLELQHLQYFSTRDMLAVLTAFATDNDTNLKAISHNSGLPDYQKTLLSEGFAAKRMDALYGDVGATVDDFASRYFGEFTGNLKKKGLEMADSAAEAITGITDLIGATDDMEDMSAADGMNMVGGMVTGALGEKLSPIIGKKLKKYLMRNPAVRKQSNELMYLFENMPTELNAQLREWDGSILPERLTGKYPALKMLNAAILKDTLIEAMPKEGNSGLKVVAGIPKGEETAAVPWDLLSRKALVEIIPGLLSAQLQMQEQMATGEKVDKQIYSADSGTLVREGDEAKRIEGEMFDNLSRKQNKLTGALLKVTGSGSGAELSKEAEAAFKKFMLSSALNNDGFKMERLAKQQIGTEAENEEIQKMFADSKGDVSQRNLSGARIFKDLKTGQAELQEEIIRLSKLGRQDVLHRMGLLKTENGVTNVDQDNFFNKSFNLADNNDRSGISNDDGHTRGSTPNIQRALDVNYVNDDDVISNEHKEMLAAMTASEVTNNATGNVFNQQRVYESPTPTDDMSELITKRVRELFFSNIDGIEGVPVHIQNTGVKQEENSPNLDEIQNNILQEGFVGVVMAIDKLASSMGTGGGGNPGEGSSSSSGGGWIKNILSGAGNFTKNYYTGMGNFTKGLGGGIGGIVNGALGGVRKLTNSGDIYIAGQKEPAIRKSLMKQGFYKNSESGKVIRSIKDIEGEVIDSEGNVVISKEDALRGLHFANGISFTGLKDFVMSPISSIASFNRGVIDNVMAIPKAALTTLKNINSGPKDVYVRGNPDPVMYKYIMKNGGYFSKATGKPIFNQTEIDGEILDAEGNIVISMDDIKKGLVDRYGRKIDAGALTGLITSTLKKGLSLGGSVIKSGIDFGNTVMKGGLDGIVGLKNAIFSGKDKPNSPADVESETDEYLAKIYDFMLSKWGGEEDTIRTNSWQDLKAKRAAKQTGDAEEPEVDEDGKEIPKPAIAGGMIGMMGGLISSVKSGFGNLMTGLSTIGTLLSGWFAWSRTASATETAGDVLGDIDGGKKKGKGGFFKKMLAKSKGLLGKGAGALMNAGRSVIPAILSAAPVIASGVATGASAIGGAIATGAAAVGSVLSAPVVLGALAVAGVGYGGYKIFQHYQGRRDAPPLESLRFLQYGFDPTEEDMLPLLRELEENALDEVSFSGGGATINITVKEATEKWAEDFGASTEQEVYDWGYWFARRFIPVFMVHIQKARMIDSSLDFTELDSELSPANKIKFVTAVISPANFPSGNPTSILTSPIPGKTIGSNAVKIRNLATQILEDNKVGGKVEQEKVNETREKKLAEEAKSDYATAGIPSYMRMNKTQSTGSYSYNKTAPATPKTFPKTTDKALVSAGENVGTGKGIRLIVPCTGRISSPYGVRIHPVTKNKKMHKGVDVAAPISTPVKAAAKGTIYRRYRSKSYGNVIYIQHENGMATRYAHLSAFASNHVGSEVSQGEVIGYVGDTGISAGAHLHWELRKTCDQWADALDPLKFVAGNVSKDLIKEEKALKEEEKISSKEGKDGTLEGQDTIASTVLPDALPDPKIAKAEAKAKLNERKKQKSSATKDVSVIEAQVKATQEMNKSMAIQSKQATDSFTQRSKMLANQATMIAQFDGILQLLLAANKTNGTKSPVLEHKTQTKVKSVVDLTD